MWSKFQYASMSFAILADRLMLGGRLSCGSTAKHCSSAECKIRIGEHRLILDRLSSDRTSRQEDAAESLA
jgi:hypothetical protein